MILGYVGCLESFYDIIHIDKFGEFKNLAIV